jgi:methionyl-tRNA formyltransferase
MRILILTSKDHLYANAVLHSLLTSGTFDTADVVIWEQDWVIPYQSKWRGLRTYWRRAGMHYTLAQVTKQFLFLTARKIARMRGERTSSFYPYYCLNHPSLIRTTVHDLRSKHTQQQFRDLHPDLLLSIFSKEIIPPALLSIPRYGCVNLHPSLLPAYRGISPTFWCLANGEQRTGVTLHYMDEHIDAGMVIAQQEIPIIPRLTEHALYLQSARIGASLIKRFIQVLPIIPPRPAHRPPSAPQGTVFSIPMKEAVRRFTKRGHRFLRFRELHGTGTEATNMKDTPRVLPQQHVVPKQHTRNKSFLIRLLYTARNLHCRHVFQTLRSSCKGDVLDVGGGGFFETAKARGVPFGTWTTLEPSLEHVPTMHDLRHQYVCGDGCNMPFESNRFDTVLCLQVLEHVVEPLRMTQEIARVLKVNGVGVFLIPQTGTMHLAPRHYYNFTRFWIHEAMQRSGLHVVELRPIGGVWATVASRLLYFFLQSARFAGMSTPECKRRVTFYVLYPLMVIYALVNIPLCLLFSLADLTEEANNHLVIVRKPLPFPHSAP